jgi:N-formylglutamate deformylase
MILHIPHSSTKIDYIKVDNIKDNINKITDLYTDELFEYDNAEFKIVFPYNRLVVDVERFKKDPMESIGKGYIYKTDVFNNTIKRNKNNFVFEKLYDDYHRDFNNCVHEYLSFFPIAFIVDCHSFPNDPFEWEKNLIFKRPDICLGTDDNHTPKEIISLLTNYFNKHNLSTNVNYPYKGTIIPSDFKHKSDIVKSIMIEINRSLYLDKEYNKNDNFYKIKKIINGALNKIDEWTHKKEQRFWESLR